MVLRQTGAGLLLGEEPHLLQLAGPRLLVIWRTELGFLDTRISQVDTLDSQRSSVPPLAAGSVTTLKRDWACFRTTV